VSTVLLNEYMDMDMDMDVDVVELRAQADSRAGKN